MRAWPPGPRATGSGSGWDANEELIAREHSYLSALSRRDLWRRFCMAHSMHRGRGGLPDRPYEPRLRPVLHPYDAIRTVLEIGWEKVEFRRKYRRSTRG